MNFDRKSGFSVDSLPHQDLDYCVTLHVNLCIFPAYDGDCGAESRQLLAVHHITSVGLKKRIQHNCKFELYSTRFKKHSHVCQKLNVLISRAAKVFTHKKSNHNYAYITIDPSKEILVRDRGRCDRKIISLSRDFDSEKETN
jgi:hypothetical protein